MTSKSDSCASAAPELDSVLYPVDSFRNLLKQGKRLDTSRSLHEVRPVVIKGSSTATPTVRLHLGATCVTATAKAWIRIFVNLMGIPVQVDLIHEKVEEASSVAVSVEVTSLCHLAKQKATLLSKQCSCVLNSILSDSGLYDTKAFSIPDSVSKFGVHLHVSVLDADGGIMDAALLSCLAALRKLELPVVEIDADGRAIVADGMGEGCSIDLTSVPSPLTIGRFENMFIVDPTDKERTMRQSRMMIVVDEDDRLLYFAQSGRMDKALIEKGIVMAKERRRKRQ